MQTAHNIFPRKGLPGELFDAREGQDIITCQANEDLAFGRWVELVTTGDTVTGPPLVQLPQQTCTTTASGSGFSTGGLIGVVIRPQQQENNTWPANTDQGVKAGSRVSVLRRGRIFAERDTADSLAVTRFAAVGVDHSSVYTTSRGKTLLSQSILAAGSTAGTEANAITLAQVFQDEAADSGGASNANIICLEVYVK